MSEPTASEPLIVAERLRKTFDRNEVLKSVSLTVHQGEVVSLLGPSGCGKSTFLRCMNLLETPQAGRLQLAGVEVFDDRLTVKSRELVRLRRRLGMVFQQFNLFPHLTVIENIVLPLCRGLNLDADEALERAVTVLDRVGLKGKVLAYPETLSGGQQQRVGIARALALRPLVLLFDEPTSSLDPESTGEVLALMRELAEEGMAMVVATHEIHFARSVSNRAMFLEGGVVVEEGNSESVLGNPSVQRTRDFLRLLGGK